MLKLGEMNRLTAVKLTEHGMYLAEAGSPDEKVLLPIKQVGDLKVKDEVTVFLYKDSKDRLIATTKDPLIHLHETALLKVSQVGKIGAFVNWGLEKDLLLPYKEQTKKVNPDEEVLVALYIDKTGRLCLTMNVYEYLRTDSSYQVNDEVSGRVYLVSERFGAFVAVDDCYSGLIPRKELFEDVKVGRFVDARVSEVKGDGKLTLSIRKKAYLQMDEDAEKVMEVIRSFDGVLPFNDKVSPDIIRREFNMSKNEFKRAVGKLYKERRVEITDHSIRMI